jgi:L-ascorbate metabolism protein UlaG (beta-lactamase superfamily)
MNTHIRFLLLSFLLLLSATKGAEHMNKFECDTIQTDDGDITITFVGHASLIIEHKGLVIHIDPWGEQADYSTLPKADLLLITHTHFDHMDKAAIATLSKDSTDLVVNPEGYNKLRYGILIRNGMTKVFKGISVEAVPAYNTTTDHEKYHPKGRGNGYILTIGGKRIYIAGDTEDIPEMAELKNIDYAFLPMNQPYTMTPEQVVSAAKMFKPKVLYPYHTGDTDVSLLEKLMAGEKDIELRIRKMN